MLIISSGPFGGSLGRDTRSSRAPLAWTLSSGTEGPKLPGQPPAVGTQGPRAQGLGLWHLFPLPQSCRNACPWPSPGPGPAPRRESREVSL